MIADLLFPIEAHHDSRIVFVLFVVTAGKVVHIFCVLVAAFSLVGHVERTAHPNALIKDSLHLPYASESRATVEAKSRMASYSKLYTKIENHLKASIAYSSTQQWILSGGFRFT